MKNQSIKALPIVAAAYAEKFGVKVTISGGDAYTNGSVINLPVLKDAGVNDALWGFLAHEAAHVKHTDFQAWNAATGNALVRNLTNVFEDCRIETEMVKTFPGTKQTLDAALQSVLEDGGLEVSTDMPPAEALAAHCLIWSRRNVCGQSLLDGHAKITDKAVKSAFAGTGVYVRLSALLRKVAGLSSTAEAVKLAGDVVSMLQDEEEKLQQQQQSQDQNQDQNQGNSQDQGDGSGSGQGQDDQSQSNDGGKGKQDGQAQGEAGGNSQQSAQNDANDDGQSQSQAQGDSQGQSGDSAGGSSKGNQSQSGADAIKKALAAEAGDLPKDVFSQLAEKLSEKADKDLIQATGVQDLSVPKSNLAIESFSAGDLVSKCKSTSVKVRAQLQGIIQAENRIQNSLKRTGNRIAANKLYRVAAADTRVFAKSTNKQAPNTAIHILVDMSGSMGTKTATGETLANVAIDAAMALALALEPIKGVNLGVSYFGGCNDVDVVLNQGQKVVSAAKRFKQLPAGGTPMTEGIIYALSQLSKQKEPKKVVFVVTDGEPNDSGTTKWIVEQAEKNNVQLYGIGIQTNSVERFFSQSTIINKVEDLKNNLFKLVKDSLLTAA